LWAEVGLAGEQPAVDFEKEVAIWFGTVHSGSCPRMRFNEVLVDEQRSLVTADLTYLDQGVCTSDANPHAYIVALERSRLPQGPFVIQLETDPPPGGLARTVVDVDLSSPGSVAQPGDLHRQDTSDEPQYTGPGGFIEPGFEAEYQQSVRCGLEWLGPLNGYHWRTDEASGSAWLPDEWRESVDASGRLVLALLLSTEPPILDGTANGHTVTYSAVTEEPPACE
jgi:hypothetical protein